MEFVGVGAASANTGNTAGRSISPAVPAGVQAGDVLVIYLVGANHTSVGVCEVNTPSGWTALLADETSPTASANYIFVKTAGGSESAPTISVGTSGGEKAQMAALRGVTLPVDDFQSDSTQSSASSSQIQWPSVTPTAGSSMVLAFGATWAEWTSVSASSGFTLISQSTNVRSMVWQYKLHTGGTVPSDVFSFTGTTAAAAAKRGFAAVFPSANEAPTADAGPDQEVWQGATVQLDGTGSSDPDGDTLSYSWTVLDDGGTGLTTGDLTGANTATPSFTAPGPGTYKFLEFDYADGDRATVPYDSSLDVNEHTVYARIRLHSGGDTGYRQLMQQDSGGGGLSWHRGLRDDRIGTWYDRNTGNWVPSNLIAHDGEWHDVVYSYDPNGGANNQRIYIDGAVAAQRTVEGDWSTGNGTLNLLYSAFDGDVADLRLYGRALTEAEAAQLWSGRPVDSGLISRWKFDEGSGTTLNDSVGSNHGTLTGGTWDTAPANTMPPEPYSIVLQLEVDDGAGGVDTDTVTITVIPNSGPTADAGEDLEGREGDEVQLDGTGSSDPDGDTLTYSWEVIDDDGTGLTTGDLTGANTATPTFIAPTPTNVVFDGAYATGGTVTESGGYRTHTFLSGGTLTVDTEGEIEYLVVGGGGGAGGSNNSIRGSGGGGAGGVLTGSTTLAAGDYTIAVGSGGPGGSGLNQGSDGGDSTFNGLTAQGGGGGGHGDNNIGHDGRSGGSGGGAGAQIGAGGAGTAGQGNAGGDTTGAGLGRGGAGGGGASAAGSPGESNLGGNGGAGVEWPSGSGNFYAGGGGGGMSGGGAGGSGVGGQGDGSPAAPNTGSGGGGTTGTPGVGGAGSDGIVIVRYPIPNELVRANIVLRLTVTDPSGATDTDTVTVTVIPAALIDFTGTGGVLVGGSALAEYVTPDTVAGSGGVLVGGSAVVEDLTFTILADVEMSGGLLLGGHADASKLSFEVHEPVPPAVLLPTYEAVLVARVPALTGPPELVVVDRLVVAGLSYTHELNRPGQANLGLPVRSLSPAVKERLANLARFPCEVWIYRDEHLDWAGEIQTLQVQGQTLTINCTGLLGYMFRMGVTEDLVFNDEDQFTIAKALVDHWQELPQGHYGIDTSDIETSGVTRDRTYLRDELHNIGERLQELAEVENGFDLHVDPATRKLVLSYPQRGRDLTASVFFDERNIDSAAVALSVSPDDLVTDVSATGTRQQEDGENTVTYAARENLTLRGWYGRSWAGVNFSNVSQAETVTAHADAYLAARDGVFFQPGVTIMPRPGADVGDFEPGDTVSYSYDAGLGLMSGEYRVAKVTVTVNEGGEQRIGVEFV